MTAKTISRRALIAWFTDELIRAQQQRPSRQRTTESGELEWIVFERARLTELVNAARTDLGLSVVDAKEIMRIENSAVGHVDYTQKLAIRAAELVLAG